VTLATGTVLSRGCHGQIANRGEWYGGWFLRHFGEKKNGHRPLSKQWKPHDFMGQFKGSL
jgi:hypothetical protein